MNAFLVNCPFCRAQVQPSKTDAAAKAMLCPHCHKWITHTPIPAPAPVAAERPAAPRAQAQNGSLRPELLPEISSEPRPSIAGELPDHVLWLVQQGLPTREIRRRLVEDKGMKEDAASALLRQMLPTLSRDEILFYAKQLFHWGQKIKDVRAVLVEDFHLEEREADQLARKLNPRKKVPALTREAAVGNLMISGVTFVLSLSLLATLAWLVGNGVIIPLSVCMGIAWVSVLVFSLCHFAVGLSRLTRRE
jgi:hypothetical protein